MLFEHELRKSGLRPKPNHIVHFRDDGARVNVKRLIIGLIGLTLVAFALAVAMGKISL